MAHAPVAQYLRGPARTPAIGILRAMATSSEPQSPSHRRWALAWVPVVAWAGLIFLASAQSDLTFVPDPALDLVVRKLGHAAVFGILAPLLWRALATTTRLPRPWAWALTLTILYAISDELHQGAVAGRYPSPLDVAIDTAGALLAVAIVGIVLGLRRQARR
jgi:VanZ family protein